MLVSLFLTFHVLYDSAVYSIQVNYLSSKGVRERGEELLRPFPLCAGNAINVSYFARFDRLRIRIATQSTYISF